MEQRGFVFETENLLSPADAVATFLARVSLADPACEFVTLEDAYGRVLAQGIVADRDYPPVPRSAMDGFALRSRDLPGTLDVVGDLAMGAVWDGEVPPRCAVRIPTGGAVPSGADVVVPIEEAELTGTTVSISTGPAPGENITERASDMRAGERVLTAGTRISAPHVGLLATLGITRVPVYARPKIAVLSSGDELVAPQSQPSLGQIRDSNRYAIAATLSAMGARPIHVPTVGDEPGELERALRAALEIADGVMVTGGSSVGERDRTPAAVDSMGEPGVIVHGLRVKPGKPTVLGAAGSKVIIGLPGNPTSAVVILQAVVAPIVAAMCGAVARSTTVSAVLSAPVRSRRGWTWYVPVRLEHEAETLVAHPLPLRSSTVSIIAIADGYVVVPEDVEFYPAGTIVPVARFI